MLLVALDPGTHKTGWVTVTEGGEITYSGVYDNHEVLKKISDLQLAELAIEMIASYGMAVGAETFETVRWIGRFQQAYRDPEAVRFIYRKDVKIHLCGSMKAKDQNIRQALIDKLGAPGTKKAPGPTYGVTSHAWSALAVAITALETKPK